MTDLLHEIAANPWLVSYAIGILTGMTIQRRLTRWTLGGRL